MDNDEMAGRERLLMQTLDRMRKLHIYDLHPDVNPADVRLMEIVDSYEDGISVSQLTEELDMPMPAVSRMMRGLEANGLITRQILPQDRRRVSVHITPDGRRVYIECLSRMDGFLEELLQIIDLERFDEALGFCNEMLDQIEQVLEHRLSLIEDINIIKVKDTGQ